MLQNQSQPKSISPSEALKGKFSPTQLHYNLRGAGCTGCELGRQCGLKGPVVYRGNPQSKFMIVGEGPGKDEDKLGKPFTGPAGQLLDKWWKCIGYDTNDWYLGNVIKCRPIAPQGSGKQNLTPTTSQRNSCRSYIEAEINFLQPKLVVPVGKTAAVTLLPHLKDKSMGDLAGTICFSPQWPSVTFFVLYHPAALLHASSKDPATYQQMRLATWEHLKYLRDLIKEL